MLPEHFRQPNSKRGLSGTLLRNSQQFGQPARERPKSLHSQFGQKHDINSARNTYGNVLRLLMDDVGDRQFLRC